MLKSVPERWRSSVSGERDLSGAPGQPRWGASQTNNLNDMGKNHLERLVTVGPGWSKGATHPAGTTSRT